MRYAGKVYCADSLVGHICANSMTALKRKASTLCNRDYHVIDTMMLHRANDEEVDSIKFTRVNKLSPDNRVIRGVWR